MRSLIFVSRSRVGLVDCLSTFDDLQAISLARNSMLDITGVLLAIPEYFAEQLEGPPNNVDAVMASIRIDARHHDLRIVQQVEGVTARFPNWRMLRFNGESAGEGGIAEIIASAHQRCDPFSARRLERLITTVADGRAGARV